MDNKLVEKMLMLRGLSIIGVVLAHAIGWGFTAMFWWTDRYMPVSVPNFDQFGNTSYYFYRVLEQLVIFMIPAFFFVSGYFMQRTSQKEEVLWGTIFTRIRRLAIPYIIWSIATILLDIIQGSNYTISKFIIAIITGSSAPAFWFVPALIQLYILSPIIIKLVKDSYKWFLPLMAIIQILSSSLSYAVILNDPIIKQFWLFIQSWIFIKNVFWFALGITIGFHLEKLDGLLKRARWLLVALLVVSFILGMYEWEVLLKMSGQAWIEIRETLIDAFYAFFFIFTFLAFREYKLPYTKQIISLGSKSYGVYLVHSLVITFVARIIYHVAPIILSNQLVFYSILIFMGFAVPLFLMELVARISSGRYYAYLFGRRELPSRATKPSVQLR